MVEVTGERAGDRTGDKVAGTSGSNLRAEVLRDESAGTSGSKAAKLFLCLTGVPQQLG
jgi:hypothetical protein